MVVLLSYSNNNRKLLTPQGLNGAGAGTSSLSLERVAVVYGRGHLAELWPNRQGVREKKHSDLTFLLPSRLLLVLLVGLIQPKAKGQDYQLMQSIKVSLHGIKLV